MGNTVLKIENMNVSFVTKEKRTDVIRGVSLEVGSGEIVGLVGESGSGKSVSMYSVMHLTGPQAVISGKITFNGEDVSSPDSTMIRQLRRRIGVIFQDPMTTLNPVFTVGSQMRDAMNGQQLTRKEKTEKAVKLLESVGISEAASRMRQYPHQFSGGQRQRIVIAMALAKDPLLIIADEPTTALDVTVQAQILDLLRDVASKRNVAVVMITHDLGVIAETCSRVNVMYAGKICESGSVRDIFYSPKHEYTKGLLRAVPNPDGGDRLIPIGGSAVNIMNLPKGCAFCSRCPEAMRICLESQPDEMEIGPGHTAACWMNAVPAEEEK